MSFNVRIITHAHFLHLKLLGFNEHLTLRNFCKTDEFDLGVKMFIFILFVLSS